MKNPISFTEYEKISDTIMFFNKDVSLKFNLKLSRISNGTRIPYHSEYLYNINNSSDDKYSIKRQLNCFFTIEFVSNFENNIMLRAHDIPLLRMVLNSILSWIMGDNRIYGFDDEEKLIIKGKFTKIDFPLSDYKFLSFIPIVIDYNDNTSKEGIRIYINSDDNYIDIDINKFMEFYYYIQNIDMYNAALSMMNYVKTQPYGENLVNLKEQNSQNNFFNNIK